MPVTIDAVQMQVLQVSPQSRWTFVEIETSDGLRGVGEATLGKREDAIASALAPIAASLLGTPLGAASHAALPPAGALPHAAARAALDQALFDVRAQAAGCASAALLGGQRRTQVEMYANLNRRTRDRSVAGFAASARDAIAAGFGRVKIAPFDEVHPDTPAAQRAADARQGIERVFAVRDAIGSHTSLMVDCHWRFDEASSLTLIGALAPATLDWLECPIPEGIEALNALRRLRAAAHAAGMRLAGNELGIGLEGFRPYLDAGAYDVMMPDVKYVGSLQQIVDMAEDFRRAGTTLSLHNPNGPVCHAASLQVSAALPDAPVLEMQLGESEWFDRLVRPALPAPVAGRCTVPSGGGIGVALEHAPAALLAGMWRWGKEPRNGHGLY